MDATWINCPHCGLKHRPRAQALCPRCGRTSAAGRETAAVAASSVPNAPVAPVARVAPVRVHAPAPVARAQEYVPTVEYIPSLEPTPVTDRTPDSEPTPQAAASSGTSAALPLGGAILLLNAVLHLFEFLFLPAFSTDASLRAAQLAGTLVGVGLDTLLGISFLQGSIRFRTLAFVRLVIGMFLFGGMSLYQAQYLFTLVVVAFSCGVLVLVWGKPSSFLAGAGLTAVLLGVGVEVIGFTRLAATQSLSERLKISLRPDLEGRQLGVDESIVGVRHPYTLRVPSDGWFRRKADMARLSEAHIDLWLSQPDHGAHLTVSVRGWSEVQAEDLREARELELGNLRAQYPDFQETDSSDNGTALEAPSVATLSGSATRNGRPSLFEVSLYRTGDKLLRVMAFAPTQAFEPLHLAGATTGLQPD
ncbi:hypothetical protein JQX13_43550 [Archangium violaceum]|uniref:hypothetical protein n=1 Tax=Archangium violaceum TaxID=83451 RepID=UPI00193BED54|nr:hypothetical protein [Archangium violaceum]QRK06869.1 hypothetical protein JQX13_43550 [Archangium violaceum]